MAPASNVARIMHAVVDARKGHAERQRQHEPDALPVKKNKIIVAANQLAACAEGMLPEWPQPRRSTTSGNARHGRARDGVFDGIGDQAIADGDERKIINAQIRARASPKNSMKIPPARRAARTSPRRARSTSA